MADLWGREYQHQAPLMSMEMWLGEAAQEFKEEHGVNWCEEWVKPPSEIFGADPVCILRAQPKASELKEKIGSSRSPFQGGTNHLG